MNKLLVVFFALTGLVGVASADELSEALNPAMTFTSSGSWTTEWQNYGYVSGYVAKTPSLSGQTDRWVQTQVMGCGTIRFTWDGSCFTCLIDGVVDEDCKSGYWNSCSTKIKSAGNHTIRWNWRNPSSSYVSYGYLDQIEWIPAPASVTVHFDAQGGMVSTHEKTFAVGGTYGTLPTPTRTGYVFAGWYVKPHVGRQIQASDSVDWDLDTFYARWVGGSAEKELAGIASSVCVNDSSKWSYGNGMTTVVPQGSPNITETWISAQVEGEAILSFDWVLSCQPHDSYGLVSGWLELDILVDGEEARRPKEAVDLENLYDPFSSGYWGAYYPDGMFVFNFDPDEGGELNLTTRVYMTPGPHSVMWRVRPMSVYGGDVYVTIQSVRRESVGDQTSIFDFGRLVEEFRIWRPNNMAYLRDEVYGRRIAANSADYEARTLRAVSKLGTLGDNPKAREIIASCGYVVADYTFRTTGEFVGLEKAPLSQDVVDTLLPDVIATVDSALEDLRAIPTDWTGRFEIRPENYGCSPITPSDQYNDDKVHVGLAEVSILRGAVEMLRAQLKLLKGYDYEADYLSVSNALESAEYVSEVLTSAPKIGTVRNLSDLVAAKEDFRAALESVKRADAAIMNRGDYDTYLFEYDLADKEEIEECRKILNQVEASLDATNRIDLTYFGLKYDTNGVVRAKILGGEFVKPLFLGAIFAGNLTRELAPEGFINRDLNRVDIHMQTIKDPTLGGLLPWVTLNDIARYYPFTQEWDLSSYLVSQPEVTLGADKDFIVYCTAERDGNLTYSASLPGVVYCFRDWADLVDWTPVTSVGVQQTIAAEAGHVYSLHFVSEEKMAAPACPLVITEAPLKLPDGGPYTEMVNGVEITFEVIDGGAWIGTSDYDQGVPEATVGTVTIPAKLGGRPVVGIHDSAFYRCRSIEKLVFAGDEPEIEEGAFYRAVIGQVLVTRAANWPKPLPTTWQGFPIGYVPAQNPAIAVTPSQPSGTFAGSTTLSLSANVSGSIYYTLDGSEPTTASPRYTSPLAISRTTTVKFYAIDGETGDWSPVSSVTLTRIPAQNATIVVTPSVPDGTRFVGSQSVALTAAPGETIWYTTDGSNPKTSPTRQQYNGAIPMSASTTLKYYAVNQFDDWSEVQTANYTKRLADGGPYTETVDGVTYTYLIVNGEATIGTGRYNAAILTETSGALVIPSALGGCPVTTIGDYAFFSCRSLQSVTLPEGLTMIGGAVFSNCSSLQSVTLPEGLSTIGDSAFSNCSSLQSVTLPEELTTIGNSAFYGCSSLQSVTLPEGLTTIGAHAFENCSSLQSVTLPEGLTTIGAYAFKNCSSLQSVRMLGDAPEVGADAFSNTSSLCTVYVKKHSTGWNTAIPGSWQNVQIRYLEDSTFEDSIDGLPWRVQKVDGVNRLVPTAELGVRELVSGTVKIPTVVNGQPVTTLGKGLFQGSSQMTSVEIPATVTAIEGSAFRECTQLEAVELPEGLLSIGDSAFRECASLKSITIPSTVTNIGYFAFRDCLRLETVELKGLAPRQDLGALMGVPAFTTISGRLGAATAVVYASVTNKTDEITVPANWLDEIAVAHGTPAGFASYQAAFEAKFGTDLAVALTMPTGKHDLKGNPLQVWQDYVAGTDPLDEEDQFKATVTLENGIPVVKWTPELTPERAAQRKYTTYGATALNGAWVDVSALSDAARHAAGYQFFRVTVEMR